MDELKLIFIGGKGGVGKSTISSALALKYAKKGQKTLLISTDPAHNLCDIFSFTSQPFIHEIYPLLFILEIDAKAEVKQYLKEVAKNTKRFIKSSSYELMDSYFHQLEHSQNAKESALFEKLVSSVVNDFDLYDKIIIDTAPTGHTLKFFKTPKQLSSYLDLLLSKARQSSSIYEGLEAKTGQDLDTNTANNLQFMAKSLSLRAKLYEDFASILADKNKSDIALVSIASKLSFEECKRAYDELLEADLAPKNIFINMLFPSSKDDFLKAHIKTQEKYIKLIEATFTKANIKKLYLQENELLGVDALLALDI